MDKKPWYASKTIWLNMILVIASALSASNIELPPEALKWIAVSGAIANGLLRTITSQPIGK
jgi:hypothetical protein